MLLLKDPESVHDCSYEFSYECSYGKLVPEQNRTEYTTWTHCVCACRQSSSFPQNTHTLHALESSIFIRILFRLSHLSDLDISETLS